MSKGNDKKAKSVTKKSGTNQSAYKQSQSKTSAAAVPFSKRIGAK
jgi:hypothetical protein